MKLASITGGSRDGLLVVVSADGARCLTAGAIAATMQAALDDWRRAAPGLRQLAAALEHGAGAALDPACLLAPLPRAYQWCEGSSYLSHMERARRARGADLPPGHDRDPLFYQGGSDAFLGPRENIVLADADWGLDVEGTLVAVTDDVPQGVTARGALDHVVLLGLANDLTLRNLIPAEFAKGVGFFQAKPRRPMAPFLVTPDEFGGDWRDGRLHLALETRVNNRLLGRLDTGADMTFGFGDLIAHAARTRPLGAGTLIGSGTVSNRNASRGTACLAETRALEIIAGGAPRTPWLQIGDRVRMAAFDAAAAAPFGTMDAVVRRAP